MSHRTYVRDLAVITATGALIMVATGAGYGRLLLAVFLIGIPIGAGLTLAAGRLFRPAAPPTAEVQEMGARRQLRAVRTVQAEPLAEVIDLHTRKPLDVA